MTQNTLECSTDEKKETGTYAQYSAETSNKYSFCNKTILITGGTGSLGKTIFREIIKHRPKKIIIFSRDEFKQKQMRDEFKTHIDIISFTIGDVRNYESISNALKNVNVVFHTAALKDVVVDEANPLEAIRTNVIGTKNVISASMERKVSRVVNTSTDKAIRPQSVLGATKLLAERLITSSSSQSNPRTILCSVRYGNVLGSRGSIVPLVRKQIESQSIVKITDPDMTRYIMSLKEAAGLVISAAQIARGGETFVLKMKSVQLDNYIDSIISCVTERLQVSPKSVRMEITGSRPGERKHEYLLFEDEHIQKINEKLYVVNPDSNLGPNRDEMWYSSEVAEKMTDSEIKKIISDFLVDESVTSSQASLA